MKKNLLCQKHFSLKSVIAVILAAVITFGSCSINIFAGKANSESSKTEIDSENIAFNAAYPEIGKALNVIVSGRESETFLYRWYINNVQINNFTNTYTPVEDDLEKMLTVKVYDIDAELVGIKNMFISMIPVVYIETENREAVVKKETKLKAKMNIQGNSKYKSADVLYNGNIEIKGRGNSTWGQPKKPYKIKLDSKADLFGMGKNKHWVLLSNPFDTSCLRNDIAYKLSGKLGMNFQDGTWVELILNGDDVGLYYIAEHVRIGSTRTDITDWETVAEDAAKAIYKKNKDAIADKDELIDAMTEDLSWTTSGKFTFDNTEYKISKYYDIPDITGGYLIELTNIISDDVQFKTSKNATLNVNTPEKISDDMLQYISSYVQAFEDALYSDDYCTVYNGKKMRYTEFIDVDSFAKGVLLNDMFQNGDFGLRSTYFYKEVGGKLTYGPVWDMDWCFNNNSDTWISAGRVWISRLLQDPVFMKAVRDVYWKYRYTYIQDVIKEGGTIDTAYNEIREAALHNDEIWNCEVKFDENAEDYKFRLQNKIMWLDSTLATLDSSYSFSQSVKSDNIKLSYDNGKLNIITENINPTSYTVFVNGEFNQNISAASELNNISVKATDDDIISVVAYSDTTPIGGNYAYNQNYLTSLSIASQPNKAVYSVGDSIDLTGLKLTATYKDGSKKTVEPDMAYTKVTDTLDAQIYSYNKITDKCGNIVLIAAYGTKSIAVPITVNLREDYTLAERYINKIPAKSEDVNFVKYTAEAWEQYEALSESAKAGVSNYRILGNAIDILESMANETMIIDFYGTKAMRNDARNNLIIAAKVDANAIFCSSQDNTSQTVFKRDSSESKVLGIKQLGDIEFWSVRKGLGLNYPYLTATARYGTKGYLYTISRPAAQLLSPENYISDIEYPDCVFANCEYTITMKASESVSAVKIMENGSLIAETDNLNEGISFSFDSVGSHNVTLCYMCGGRWFEYETLNIYVREPFEASKIYYNDFSDAKDEFKIITDSDICSVKLVSDTDTVDVSGTEKGDCKVWSGTKPKDGSCTLFIGEAVDFKIQPVRADFYMDIGISKQDFAAYITDAYNNTVKTTDYIFEQADASSVGVKTVTASYKNMTASCTINMLFSENASVTINKYPQKKNFYLLEKMDISGLELKIMYPDGSTEYIDADDKENTVTAELDTKVTLKDKETFKRLGQHEVTVRYKDFEVPYQVNVSFNLIFAVKAVFKIIIHTIFK